MQVVDNTALPCPDQQPPCPDNSTRHAWLSWTELDQFVYTSKLVGASVVAGVVVQPFVVVTTRQQFGSVTFGQMPMSKAFRDVYREIGVKGLFRGTIVSTIGGPPANAVYYVATEATREVIQKFMAQRFPNVSPGAVDAIQAPLSSIVANTVSLLPFVPAEVISARMIVFKGVKPNLTTSVISTIWKESGFRGFYKGFVPCLANCVAHSALWWFFYSVSRRELSPFMSNDTAGELVFDTASGTIAGFTSTLFTHPVSTITTRIQAGATEDSSLVREGFRLMRTEGARGLFRGLSPSLYSASIGSAVLSLIYQYIKRSSVPEPRATTVQVV